MSKKKIARDAKDRESDEIVVPTVDRRKRHIDGIKKTAVSSVLGIASGVICYYILTLSQMPENFSYLLLIVAFYVQKPVYMNMGMDVNQFTWKDWFFVLFMTVTFWFVSWTLLLN